MAKLESSFKNMVLSLLFISATMATALGYIYSITKEPIEMARKHAEVQAIKDVLPEFDNDPTLDVKQINGLNYYEAIKGEEITGYAIKTFTEKGYSGRFTLMIGFTPDGTIYKIAVLEQKETPGLGSKIKEPKFKDQFFGKNPAKMKLKVKNDGGEVDAITAATISSRAFCDAVQKAFDGFELNCIQNHVFTKADSVKIDSLSRMKGGLNE